MTGLTPDGGPAPDGGPIPDGGLSPRELQRRAARGVTWSTVSVVVSLPLAIVVSVVLARRLGPEEYARLAYLSFLVPTLLIFTELGFSWGTIRLASRTFAAGDIAATRDVLSKAQGWSLIRVPIVSALALLFVRPPSAAVGLLVVLTVIATLVGASLNYSVQAENRGAVAGQLALVQGVASAVAAIVVTSLSDSGTTAWAVMFATGAFVQLPGWLALANPALRRAALTPKLPRGLPAGFWGFALSAVALAGANVLVFSRSEILILHALGKEQALAVFALAFGLSQRLTTPVDTLLTPLIPALSALGSAHPEHLHPGFSRALRLSSTAVAFLAAAALVGTMLVAPVLFGPEYEGTGSAFAALASVSLLQSAAQPYIAVAHAVGRLGVLIRANGVALVADVALALALIPPLGVWGAVIANVAGGLIAVVLSARLAAFAPPVRETGAPVAKLLAVSGCSIAAAYGLGDLASGIDQLLGALVAFCVGTASFVALGRLFGGLLPERDTVVLLDVLPGRLARVSRAFLPVLAKSRA